MVSDIWQGYYFIFLGQGKRCLGFIRNVFDCVSKAVMSQISNILWSDSMITTLPK